MPVSLIAAVAANLLIGDEGKLPWRIPDDLARFKRLTVGHAVVMGRKTFESMGKPLSGRRNIVLTRDARLSLPGCEMAHTREEAIAMAGSDEELFVIGGASIYELFLPIARRMYLTHVEGEFHGDIFFPEVHWEQWQVVKQETGRSSQPGTPTHRFVDYERIRL
ncbi:MAG: dihydrofolate reductase [Spirochaetia bacterium]|jgi:dihydrofolate reductase